LDVDRKQRNRQAQQGGQKDGPDLAGIARHGIADKFSDVVVNAPAFTHRSDDGGKVVVQQDQTRRLARHVGAAPAHRHTDIGPPQGRCIVHPISGHCDKLAPGLQGLDNANFLRRIDAGIDAHGRDMLTQCRLAHRGQLRPRQDRRVTIQHDAQTARYGQRRCRMVARDHHRRYAGREAIAHGSSGLRPWRIDQTHQSDQAHSGLHRLDLVGRGQRRMQARGQGQHAQALCRHGIGGGQHGGLLQGHRAFPAPL
jgi:hypothetical protein